MAKGEGEGGEREAAARYGSEESEEVTTGRRGGGTKGGGLTLLHEYCVQWLHTPRG